LVRAIITNSQRIYRKIFLHLGLRVGKLAA
jgi:hypothetical protein